MRVFDELSDFDKVTLEVGVFEDDLDCDNVEVGVLLGVCDLVFVGVVVGETVGVFVCVGVSVFVGV